MWRKSQDEPVILTLSSDEDEESNSCQKKCMQSLTEDLSFKLKNQSTVLEQLNPKEPIILPNQDRSNIKLFHQNFPDSAYEQVDKVQISEQLFVSLQCRSLRIGSYKVVPIDRVIITYNGMKVSVPPFAEGKESPVNLVFPIHGIMKVLAHFGNTLPVLFFYLTDSVAKSVRDKLQMNDENGFYFNPCSQEESQKRLTILPEKMKTEVVNMIKNFLNFEIELKGEKRKMFEELNQKDANEILVRSSPVEIDSLLLNSKATVTYETRTLLVFPPPPNKGGISITMDDYCCLKEEQFLNDVLVDFYFNWLHTCHLSEEDREKTHMFSTFFYKRLTSKQKLSRRHPSTEDDPNLSPAQKRHARVKSWTKNVDIFTKDFILIPINEHSHWFLAVICFPGLSGPIRIRDGQPVPVAQVTQPTRLSGRQKRKVEPIPIIDDGDWSDRDEAEGDDNELFDDDEPGPEPPKKKAKQMDDNGIKQPCILILDSLSGASRSRIVATLRDYLAVEHLQRKGEVKEFSRDTMQGACPKVPQQNNFSDCGLFTLQFAQSFFERPVKDFALPIRSLCDWFKQDVVGRKRESVANLIRSLMDEHKPNHGITLPPLSFSSIRDKVDSIGQSEAEEETAVDSGQENGGKRLNDDGEEKIPGLGTGPENGDQKLKAISKDINSKCRKGANNSSKRESLLNDSENKSSFLETNVDESTDLSSCSSTIKFLSRILDRPNSLVNSKKDPKGTPAANCQGENSSPVNSEEKTETHKAKPKKQDRINSLSNSLDESRSKNNSVPLSTSENRLKSSLHLLRDSYSGSGNSDEEDELFLSKKANEPKSVENSLNSTRKHSER